MKRTIVLSLALVLTLLAVPAMADEWTGWITDESCGAKGANAGHKDCAMKCLENGEALVFYNTADEKIYQLDNQDTAKQHIGHEVKVTGTLEGEKIVVESIEASGMDHSGHGDHAGH
jgi:hypothetical protein